MLHLVQSEQGYVTPDGIAFCADSSASPRPRSPRSRRSTRCTSAAPPASTSSASAPTRCAGCSAATRSSPRCPSSSASATNETTADGTITLEHAECLAACDYAPVVTVNYEFFDNQTVGVAPTTLVEPAAGGRAARAHPRRAAVHVQARSSDRSPASSTRRPCAGANGTGVPTEVGVQLALERGESAPSYATRTRPRTAAAPGRGAARQGRALTTRRCRPPNPIPAPGRAGRRDGGVDAAHSGAHQAVRHRPAVEDRQLRARSTATAGCARR